MYCKKCGNEIKDNEKFCSNCGAERPSMEAEEQKPLDKNDISQESVEEKTAVLKRVYRNMRQLGKVKRKRSRIQ